MIPLFTKCRKCGKPSPPVRVALGEPPGMPEGWRVVVIGIDLNKYREIPFCPDCFPAIFRDLGGEA